MWDLRELRGCGTALVTPFRAGGELDEDALRRLVAYQLQEGIDFLVPCGTTGESVTLEHDEYLRVIALVIKEVKGRVPVIAGAGGNNTRKVIRLIAEIQSLGPLGVDGILSVAPYYNKPTQEGFYQHFRAIAESTDLPMILYNVPGRTGSNVAAGTTARLSTIPNIVGIKEASGNLIQIAEIVHTARPGFRVLSGDDAVTLPVISVGGVGGHLSGRERSAGADGAAGTSGARKSVGRGPQAERALPALDAGQLHRIQPHPGQGCTGHDGPDSGGLSPAAGADAAGESRPPGEGTARGGTAPSRKDARVVGRE